MNPEEAILQFLYANYDYIWFKSRFEKIKNVDGAVNLITGSSHSLCGLKASEMSETINISMHSQDLFYDFASARKSVNLLKNSAHINTCFIVLGYYIAFQDLGKSPYGRSVIKTVWYPTLHELRHYSDFSDNDLLEIRDYCNQLKSYAHTENVALQILAEKDDYFNSLKPRKTNRVPKIWELLSEEERLAYAKARAEEHNRLEAHVNSYEDNCIIINNYIRFLITEDIKPVIVITPFPKEYYQFLSKSMIKSCFDLVEQIPYPVEYIDLNDYQDTFEISDFIDTDHMSEQGAIKLSHILNQEFLTN